MDLSLVPLEELRDEIDNRFNNVVILVNRVKSDSDVYEFHRKGGDLTSIGMCEQMVFNIKTENQKLIIEGPDFD